jgi:hypothetical protein
MLVSLRQLWKTHKNPRWLFPTRAATNPVGRGTLNRTFAAWAFDLALDGVTTAVIGRPKSICAADRGSPTTGSAGCCARTASGNAAAPPSPAINSRRRIIYPSAESIDYRGWGHTGPRGCAAACVP